MARLNIVIKWSSAAMWRTIIKILSKKTLHQYLTINSPAVSGVDRSVAARPARYDRVAAIHDCAFADGEGSQSVKVLADARIVGSVGSVGQRADARTHMIWN